MRYLWIAVLIVLLSSTIGWAENVKPQPPQQAEPAPVQTKPLPPQQAGPEPVLVRKLPPQVAGPEIAPMRTDTIAAQTRPSAAAPKPKEISTQLGATDSLGVVPNDVETSYAGGTRRVHLESTIFRREEPVVYNTQGRRDPFRALIVDEKKEGEVETDLLRLDNAVLNGVVWSLGQYMAMVKDKDGKTFFLREGDPVYEGRVQSVNQSQVSFEVSDFGEYERITLKVKG